MYGKEKDEPSRVQGLLSQLPSQYVLFISQLMRFYSAGQNATFGGSFCFILTYYLQDFILFPLVM